MGVPPEAEYICFHSREAGYSPSDEDLHSFRNSSIDNYLLAVAELTGKGFWAIRMGDPTMRRIPSMERVIDYALLDAKSDWLDVFLCASCKFFIGSASGLLNLANVFGRPCAIANQAPLSHVLGFSLGDLAIPKLMWLERERRYMSFPEVLRSDAANFRCSRLFQEHGIHPVENTAEDVRALALEMLERVESRTKYDGRDEASQRRFAALMRPGHYSYGGINRVGRDFLRKYAHLMGDGPNST
jgi:putative glycosyltransferase (TIGR04372 family)